MYKVKYTNFLKEFDCSYGIISSANMAMETPGPLEIGREFVRQYYTMLNEAPLHLHR